MHSQPAQREDLGTSGSHGHYAFEDGKYFYLSLGIREVSASGLFLQLDTCTKYSNGLVLRSSDYGANKHK